MYLQNYIYPRNRCYNQLIRSLKVPDTEIYLLHRKQRHICEDRSDHWSLFLKKRKTIKYYIPNFTSYLETIDETKINKRTTSDYFSVYFTASVIIF